MTLSKRPHLSDCGFTLGFTLLEVIFALLISGMFLITSLRFFTEQWHGHAALNDRLEAHYSVLTAGKTLADAIRSAKTAEWVQDSGVLKVLPWPDEANPAPTVDYYSVNDLDYDGIKDLYWRHLGIAQPVASYVSSWKCVEVEPGLWEISLQANVEGQLAAWKSVIRQRVSTAESGTL
jgi:hypothetical protein